MLKTLKKPFEKRKNFPFNAIAGLFLLRYARLHLKWKEEAKVLREKRMLDTVIQSVFRVT